MAEYNRAKAVKYARKWALTRNPRYISFAGIGGDCANFASQCVYAGAGVQNYKPIYGWDYNSATDRAPSWSSVKYLHRFLTTNKLSGPYGHEVDISEIEVGDIIQIAITMPEFHHTLVVVDTGDAPSLDNVIICAHSYDSLDRNLNSYDISKMRCIHIDGVRR